MHITIEQHNEDIASYKAEIAELEEYIEKLITAGTDCAVTTEVHQCSRSWFNLTNNEPLDELSFLDDIPEGADNYEIEMYDCLWTMAGAKVALVKYKYGTHNLLKQIFRLAERATE